MTHSSIEVPFIKGFLHLRRNEKKESKIKQKMGEEEGSDIGQGGCGQCLVGASWCLSCLFFPLGNT